MSYTTKEDRLRAIHEEALHGFDVIQGALRDERLQCLQDRRFCSIDGAQWEGDLAAQFENKPRMQVNKIQLSVMRIISEYRNNSVDVIFFPKDGSDNDSMSDLCNGLYRADEQYSSADEAYDNAFEEAVTGGFGAARLRACYEDEGDSENDEQRIMIEPITDADSSVFFDLNAKRQDKADATRCYVLTAMSPDAYKEIYDDHPSTWPKTIQQRAFDWATPDVVFVCEYYKIEEVKSTVHIFADIMGTESRFDEDDLTPEMLTKLQAIGSKEVRTKKIKTKRVHKYILSGSKVLSDDGIIAGKCIPIIPVYGKRWFIDNIERCMGHVRLAKDIQRLKNMQISKLAEVSALSSVEKPIFVPDQVAGHQVMWAEDNLKNFPYLLVNPVKDQNGQETIAGPIGYTKSSDIPPAMSALLQITELDMQDLLGNQQAAEKLPSNVSGFAIELTQAKSDMQTAIYMSNFAKFKKRCGEVWLSMAQDIYVEEGRQLKTVDAQNKSGSIKLLTPTINAKTGATETENDLSEAKLDVSVEVGPNSASKRAAIVRTLTGMISMYDDPEAKQVLGSFAMMNMEGEGIADIREYFRKKLVALHIVKPTDEEAQAMQASAQSQQPDPQATYYLAAAAQAQADAQKALVDAEAEKYKVQIDSQLTLARMEVEKAKAVQIMSDIDQQKQKQALEVIDRFAPKNQTVNHSTD